MTENFAYRLKKMCKDKRTIRVGKKITDRLLNFEFLHQNVGLIIVPTLRV